MGFGFVLAPGFGNRNRRQKIFISKANNSQQPSSAVNSTPSLPLFLPLVLARLPVRCSLCAFVSPFPTKEWNGKF